MKSVYVMESGAAYKIGVSSTPQKRLNALRLGNRDICLIYKSIPIENAYEVESILHKRFKEHSIGREWFSNIERESLPNVVKNIVQKEGKFDEKQDASTPKEISIICDGNRTPISKYIKQLEKETEQLRIENDAIIDLIPLIFSNSSFALIVDGLLGLGWSYLDTLNFIRSIPEPNGTNLQHS